MKFLNGFIGFGPNLIFDGESSEQFPFGDDIENRLSFRMPTGSSTFQRLWVLSPCPRSTDAVLR